MSLDERDWWREDRKRKEELYGGDFSLNSKSKDSNPKNGSNENDINVLKKPLSLTGIIIFALICFVGINYLHLNAIAVIIVASIGAILPEIMKLKEGNRVKAASKTVLFTISILGGAMALVLIIFLLIAIFQS